MSLVPVRHVRVGHFEDNYLVVPANTDKEAIAKAREILGDWLAPTTELKVVKTREWHETVGRRFRAPVFVRPEGASQECVCIAWDWRTGFWMKFDGDGELRDISERAIGRTYHQIREELPIEGDEDAE